MKQQPVSDFYDFSAKPKVSGPKAKFREQKVDMANLMNDPRVVRGNTYAAVVSSKSEFKKEQQPPIKQKTQPKRSNIKTNLKFEFDSGFEPTTPRALQGRQHNSIQTEAFVQTLRDKAIQYQKQSQTDFYLDRPMQRLFNQPKTGTDYSTQIEEGDPELFNFDYEVQPILDALLSKILDTSRMELFEEQELEQKEKKKLQYQRTKNAVFAQTQKLQSNQTRLLQEQERRQLQYKKIKQQNIFTQKKLIGRILSKQYLKNLRNNTHMILHQQGFFREPLEVDLYDNFLPWLYQQIQKQIQTDHQLEEETQKLLKEFQTENAQRHHEAIQKQKDRKQQQLKKIQQGKIKKREIKEQKKRMKWLQKEEQSKQAEQIQV